jgi:hypothetical protein
MQERRETQNAHATTGLEQVQLTGYGNRPRYLTVSRPLLIHKTNIRVQG